MDKTSGNKQDKIYWHEAFFSAIQLELHEYADMLTFEAERKLSEEALIMDLLVIKKKPDAVVGKNIGRIFKEHNIFEYKSESDYLSVWDYNKAVLGYAGIYSSFEKALVEQITVSFVVTAKPIKLFEYLQSTRNLVIDEASPGVYRVLGDVFPVQVIESKKLSGDENIFLRNLRSNLTHKDMQGLLKVYGKHGPITLKSVYLDRVINANRFIFEEVIDKMNADVKDAMFEYFEKKGLLDEIKEKVKQEGILAGKQETVVEMLKNGFVLEDIAKIIKMPTEWVQNVANQTVVQ